MTRFYRRALCALTTLCLCFQAHADNVTFTTNADTITITTTDYGQLKTALEAESSTLLSTVTEKQYKGYVLNGLFSAADLRALFGANLKDPSDSIVAAYVEKLDMLGATVDSIKGKSTKSDQSLKVNDKFTNTMLPGWNKQFTQLTWWGLPKVKNTTGSYTFPSNTYTNNGNFYESFAYTMPKLQHITINEGCTTITGCAFRSCKNLSEIKVLSTTLKTLGWYCFSYCSNLSDIYELLHAGVEDIQLEAFAGANIINRHITLFPSTLKKIGSAAFRRNWNLGPVLRIPASVEEITASAFQDCALEDVYFLGTTLPQCGTAAFWGYDYLLNQSNQKKIDESYATRTTYEGFVKINSTTVSGQTPPMFHYRPDLSADELAKVTDATRSFTLTDKFFGKSRMWPTPTEFNTLWLKAKEQKTYDGTAFTDDQKKYSGIIQFPFRRADAPLADAIIPVTDGEWRTLCLPIDWAPSKELYGDYQVYTLDKVTRNADSTTVRLIFKDITQETDTLRAWTPYLFKPGSTFTYDAEKAEKILSYPLEKGSEKIQEFTAEQVGTTKEDETWTYYWMGNCEGLYHKSGEKSTNYSIDRPRYAYYMSMRDGKVCFLYQQTSKQRVWSPYTAAIFAYCSKWKEQYTDDTPGQTCDDSFRASDGSLKAKAIDTFMDEEPTAIERIEVELLPRQNHSATTIYDLSGRNMGTTTQHLPAGIYVQNGQKMVVK